MSDINYPIRINRYLLLKGLASRRKADEYISAGKVKINGRKAVLGDKVGENDVVEVDQDIEKKAKNRLYIALNKPEGIVSHNPAPGQKSVEDIVSVGRPVFPLGRLDRASWGLMILTDDGTIVDKLLNPKHEHEKEYVVEVDKNLKSNFKRLMEKGVRLENFTTKPAKVEVLSEKKFRIILTEGKKHQIRRMCDKLGYVTRDLKRIRIANIRLSKLKPGEWRKIEGKELEIFLKSINYNNFES
jgi:23S rRNA pseudouridine2604 synthase